ncbi:hypothetical protein RB596_005271 [Gaeumannomyces avenae]
MSLCEICKSIPLGNLPPFPNSARLFCTPEAPQYHYFALNNNNNNNNDSNGNDPSSPRFRYHEDRGGLWQSAAGGCGLCRLVEQEARRLDAAAPAPRDVMPNFDLWVTARRGTGTGTGTGDGFMVLSRCGDADRSDDAFAVMAAVGLCVEKDDPLATVIRGRPVEMFPGETAFGLARDWLADDTRSEQSRSNSLSTLPPRLIDVGDPATNGGTVTIVEPDPAADYRYIALMYSSPECHSAPRAPDVGAALAIDTLPQTFKDAVTLTRELGLRHLWIDALCGPPPPPPPPPEDPGRSHSERTADVYKAAHLTVAAPGTAADGLFVPRRAREYVRMPYPGATGAPSGAVLAYLLPLSEEVLELHGKLESGAVARSERVVSRRVLHFSTDQTFFEDHNGRFVSEEGLVGPRWHITSPP